MIKSLAFVACLALAATPAAALADTAEAPAKKDKLVCKRVEGTGWRLSNSSKICKKASEWAAISEANQKEYNDYTRGKSLGNFGDGAGGRSNTGN
jgi:hypothetical protein